MSRDVLVNGRDTEVATLPHVKYRIQVPAWPLKEERERETPALTTVLEAGPGTLGF